VRRAALVLLVSAGLWSCPAVDPDAGRFSCAADAECGEGFTCRPQHAGGGRCFRVGECADAETCDGVDENCDGRIDESFPEDGAPCATGVPGVCAVGVRVCVVGALDCRQTVMPSTELCNGLDDDCDGMVDEAFDLSSDEENCGQCGARCGAGTVCLAATCRESICDDGEDNDGNGQADCADDACRGLVCFTGVAPPWRCGPPALDGGPGDGGVVDGGADAGSPGDGGGPPDAGVSDAGLEDGGLPSDAGQGDGGAADGGPGAGCRPPELDCANGLDDDGDGDVDCLDADCDGAACATGSVCTNRACQGP
jgi:hypothetical protein